MPYRFISLSALILAFVLVSGHGRATDDPEALLREIFAEEDEEQMAGEGEEVPLDEAEALLQDIFEADDEPAATEEDDAPLLIDETQERIQVRPRDGAELIQDPDAEVDPEATATPAPTPTPDPSEVMVAIVNSRVLTRAELNERVTDQLESIRKDILERHGGVLMTLDERMQVQEEGDVDDEMLLEEQERQLEGAIRLEEGREVQRWIEHSLLAEEARRQRIAITDTEFRERLAQAERESHLDAETIDEVLRNVNMTRREYERSVYDALLIEKLLERYIDLNYTEADFRRAYDKRPSLFYEPETFKLAHFTITLTGEESSRRQSELRSLAQDVRNRLRNDEDPEEVFARDEFNRMGEGIFGTAAGWTTLREGNLPPQVQAEAEKLRVGQTSSVITQHRRRAGGQVVPNSYHVLKIMDRNPPTGESFETALPAIRRAALEVARIQLLNRVREARTHRVIVNLSGIPPELIPSREDLIRLEGEAGPIDLRGDDDAPDLEEAS